jgi:catechol 2,3-dioxygenase-like lactoylglutathione lyase family enzyme
MEERMQVRRILETCLYVDDLDAAEQFYTKVLGLDVYSRVSGRHVFFRCGDNMFLLFNPAVTTHATGEVPPHGAHGPGHAAFAISQASIDSWRDHLTRANVTIEQEITWPSGGRSLYFRDPSGNSLELATPATWKLPEVTDNADH